MWAVVVLGILSAVFAWVWLGGRGKKKDSEGEVTAESALDAKQHAGLQNVASSAGGGEREGVRAQSHEGGDQEPSAAHKAPLAPEEQPDLASREEVSNCTVPTLLTRGLLHVHPEASPETGSLMANHCTATLGSSKELLHAHAEATPDTDRKDLEAGGSPLPTPELALEPLHPHHTDEPDLVDGSLVLPQENQTTVCFEEHLTKVSSANVTEDAEDDKSREVCGSTSKLSETVSSKQVDLSSEEQHDCTKPDSPEPSEMVNHFSANQELTAESQKNLASGHLAEEGHVSRKSDGEELSNTWQLEDEVAIGQTAAHGETLLNEANPDLKGEISFASQSEAKTQDGDPQRTKRVAAVQPMPQNVSLGFKVHYVTQSNTQIIAVIGNHDELGKWEVYIPLTPEKDDFWSHSITLPGDANIEWKFVVVENGKIKRWEECNNRSLKTAHEDIAPQQWWGYP